jgi:hypothetical protein
VQIERIAAGISNIEHLTQGRQKQSCTVRVTAITVRCRLNCICTDNLMEPERFFADGLFSSESIETRSDVRAEVLAELILLLFRQEIKAEIGSGNVIDLL